MVKYLPVLPETWVWSLRQEDPWEEEMATHFSILAWRIPWTEEPGGLQSIGLQRVGHHWVTKYSTCMYVCVCVCVCAVTSILYIYIYIYIYTSVFPQHILALHPSGPVGLVDPYFWCRAVKSYTSLHHEFPLPLPSFKSLWSMTPKSNFKELLRRRALYVNGLRSYIAKYVLMLI